MPIFPLPRLRRAAVTKLIIAAMQVPLILTMISSSWAEVIIENDMGGSVGEYMRTIAAIRDRGDKVIIDGDCYSACTLYAAMIPPSRICVTPRAALGFHLAQSPDGKGGTRTSLAGTEVLIAMYPPKIRAWINRHGGLRTNFLILHGAELNAMYPACK